MTTCLVVMGVSGAGKSTVARLLAERLGWCMAEGDEFHPAANIDKMAVGIALTDADRTPWLSAIRDWISDRDAAGQNSLVTCSALKRSYRDILRQASARVRFVHLVGSRELVSRRLSTRSGHFMPPSLMDSQFGDLEPPGSDEDVVTVDIADGPPQIIEATLALLNLGNGTPPT